MVAEKTHLAEATLPLPSSPTAAAPACGKERRESLRAALLGAKLGKITTDEIDSHFSSMPDRYWQCVTEDDLVWGLQTIHGFLHLIASPYVSPTQPFVSWRQSPDSRQTRMMLCTWDRQGLLAKAAASFSAVKLDILEADVFTRADNIVLDVFTVVNADNHRVASPTQLQEMTFLLEGALSEPPRFASIWACSRHKFLAPPAQLKPQIDFDNETSPTSTVIQVKAVNRLGLLYDILLTVAEDGLNVMQARIATTDQRAHDAIHVTDVDGHKVTDTVRLEELRRKLEAALT